MGIITPNTADIPNTLVVSANFHNSPISLVDIPILSRMMSSLSQPIVAMHRAMICLIDIFPEAYQCRVLIRVHICLGLVHRLEILLNRFHQYRTVLVPWEEGLLAKAAPMVTVGQAEVDFAGGIIVADIVALVRIMD